MLNTFLLPATLGLLLAGSLLVLMADWRIATAALSVQTLCAGVLLATIAPWSVVLVKVLVGWLVAGMLAHSAWQSLRAPPGPAPLFGLAEIPTHWHQLTLPTGLPFRLVAVVMINASVVYLANQPGFALPGLEAQPLHNVASYALITFGLLSLGLSSQPLPTGRGLVLLLTGFELFYTALEPSLAVVGLLAAAQFGIALAVSYLTLAQAPRPPETPSGATP